MFGMLGGRNGAGRKGGEEKGTGVSVTFSSPTQLYAQRVWFQFIRGQNQEGFALITWDAIKKRWRLFVAVSVLILAILLAAKPIARWVAFYKLKNCGVGTLDQAETVYYLKVLAWSSS